MRVEMRIEIRDPLTHISTDNLHPVVLFFFSFVLFIRNPCPTVFNSAESSGFVVLSASF